MKKVFLYPLAIASLLATQSCSNDTPTVTGQENSEMPEWHAQDTPYTEIPLPTRSKEMADGANAFALNLLKEYTAMKNGTQNVAIAPFSVYTTLAMLANGDDGKARAEILNAIGNPSAQDAEALNSFCSAMTQWLPKIDGRSLCCSANSLWVDSQFELNDSYAALLSDVFDAGIEALDLSKEESVKKINQWCDSRTHGMIPQLLDETWSGADAILTNSLCFKGTWKNPFNPENSVAGNFKTADGTSCDVTYMKSHAIVDYASDGSWQMAALPYGNGNYRMLILLPAENEVNPQSLEATGLEALKESLKSTPADLSVPRFSAELKSDIVPALINMGISSMFREGLAGISNNHNVPIARVLHATKISADEKGTEAAGITAAEVFTSNFDVEGLQYLSLSFDRPFIYFIEETSSGVLLFAGQVARP